MNLSIIEKRARAARLLPETGTIEQQSIADCIFHSGFSTRDQATLISGRGLGMDAVRSILQEAGGLIEIILDENKNHQYHSFHFEIHVPLRPIVLAGAV